MKVSVTIAAAISLLACACQEPNPALISHKNVVHVPPASLFNCPVAALPKSFANNGQVAQTLVETYGNNVTCSRNIKAIHQDLLNQQKIFKSK